MKKNLLIILLLFSFSVNAQQKLIFNYDQAGNQIIRELCLSGCSSSAKQVKENTEVKEIEALAEEDLLKFSKEDVISYYPNPVKEELYIKWEVKDNDYVSSIQVFSITGQLLKTYPLMARNDSHNIPFQDYSTGVYVVILYCSSGDPKTIKIIKQ
ncbi:T9SS type A sorting domain-containing protein [Flavobacterium bizetiae]|uniref:T9SS type A sorting domain-containing protein n=1 Tax=Flavobacterium bizetiae TaxID=2704140 RepID=UPI0021E82D90|nr:T9SS type A sorting domain-containing protein [Flavobacterium bizetiae]UTN05116.1 T9SS type A sorting domain-containing protein [Flavobacterium bizetiae]